jgi:predicted SnoaL-like aldol condensation-catalyzing enzyme
MRKVANAIVSAIVTGGFICLAGSPTAAASCAYTPKQVVENFSRLFFIEKDWRKAYMDWVAEDYIQHNPIAKDGRAAALEALGPIFAANPGLKVDIKRIVADDTHVAVHYHSVLQPGTKGFAAVDLFRVEDCKIVEHWDVIQPMPEKSANPHPMF